MRKLAIALILAAACGGASVPPAPSASGTKVKPGESTSLAAIVSIVAGNNPVTWSMGTGALGTVSAGGLYSAPSCAQVLAGLPTGTDLIHTGLITNADTVSAVWATGSTTVTVIVAEGVTGITVSPATQNLPPGSTQQFEATVQYTCHAQNVP